MIIKSFALFLENNNIDSFMNLGHDEDGNLIGNCTLCDGRGVLVHDHVCNL